MVSARALVAEAKRRGARFRVVGERLEATPASVFDAELDKAIVEQKAAIIALLRERGEGRATDATLFAQALLRQGRFPPEPVPCAFHCGYPGENCRRCGAPFAEHFSEDGDATIRGRDVGAG
jgi:hypothetical protein